MYLFFQRWFFFNNLEMSKDELKTYCELIIIGEKFEKHLKNKSQMSHEITKNKSKNITKEDIVCVY